VAFQSWNRRPNENRPELVLDLDGTISDPALGIARSINYALCGFGFDPIAEDSVSRYIGPGIDNAFRTLIPAGAEDRVAALVDKFRERYADVGYSENVLYPGIPEAIRHLVSEGVTLGVCTTKRVDFAERILRHFGLRDCFQFVSGGDVGIEKHQQLRALLMDDIISAHASMIGDRAIDVLAAHANGLRSVGVLWGHGTEAELIEAEAQVLLSRPRQLMELAHG
jgi:phosphoglycolate phosphatase